MTLRQTAVRLAALTLTAGLLWPSPSHAYKMMYNTSTTTNLSVNCDYMNGFGHWTQQTIYWYYNPAGQGAGKGMAIIDALETWTDATQSDHVLQYAGTTSAGLNINDNQNTMVWGNTSSLCTGNACHAITVVRYSSQQVHYETDIVLNELMDWRTDGLSDPCTSTSAGTKVDTQAIITHELGHTLGLAHSTDSTATMGGSSCSLAGRTPNSDDLAGLQCATNRYPVNPSYEGFLDGYAGFNCTQISGWAWNADWPNQPVYVNILDGSTLQSVVHANFYRADLFAAGKGNGIHGFVTPVPQAFKNGTWHTLRAQFSGTGGELTLSPKNIICNAPLFPDPMRASQYPSTGGTVYTVGTQFSSTHSGTIVELGYLWPMSETGSHEIRLWSDTGTPLTDPIPISAPNLPPRWKWVTLPTPVSISAGVLYRVSINTNAYQSKSPCGTTNSLDTPYTNGPLTAHQGVWKTGTGFPNTGSCSNFFVNVKFSL